MKAPDGFKTFGTVTGRFSSSKPNLQNAPRGERAEPVEPLIEEARRLRMIQFLYACRDAGYTHLTVDTNGFIVATWADISPPNLADDPSRPALWSLADRFYGLHQGAFGIGYSERHTHNDIVDHHALAAHAHLVAGVYDLLGTHWQ